jgi:ATP-dependent helicase HepA
MKFVELCIKIQAIRRAFEATRNPIVPALGVGARVYPHQIANVLRILTDVRIRHLLADEVGLGKTVQALMILNALRWQRPDLKALVIVPDRLVPQWRDEIMTRAHTAPSDDEERVEGEQYIQLLWENKLRSKAGSSGLTREDADPSRFNVLIVDELHRLPAWMRDPIVQLSPEFEHLLILTATPAFQDHERHAQIFEILEPEKTKLTRREISQSERGLSEELSQSADTSVRTDWAQEELITRMHAKERDIAERLNDESDFELAALSHCVYRRVVRSRRRHYPGVLPQRGHIPVVVSPMEQEVERQRLMWEYFPYLGDLTREFNPVLLAKRVILSPPSLEQRVDFLRRKGHERAGILEQVKPLVSKRHGDSRLDALVDILNNVWLRDPEERVIVAAQDNLTVDYLAELLPARLPLIGPLRSRGKLKIALIRQGQNEEMLEDLAGYGNQTSDNLEEFQRGKAQVLLAPEVGQVGLNLQRARVLVLYSVPWSLAEVEQWIGRLDRIGNEAAFGRNGAAQYIDIYTIAQEGLVDQKVIEVLKQFRVFEQTVNLDGEHIEALERSIEEAGLEAGRRDWEALEREAYNSFHKDEGQELESPLRPYLPWGGQHAKETRDYLEALPPCPPIISKESSGPHGWDSAFDDMMKLLKAVRQYIIHSKVDTVSSSPFNTLWYTFGDFGHPRPVASKVTFTIGPNPQNNLPEDRHPRNCFTYISKRKQLQSPPLRRVTHSIQQEKVSSYLRFLSFGDQLHDELISGWSQIDVPLSVTVTFPQGHQFWERQGQPGLHTVQVFGLDAGDLIYGKRQERLKDAIVQVTSTTDLLRRNIEKEIWPFAAQLQCAMESDVRWLRSQLTSELQVVSYRRDDDGSWHRLDKEASSALLNPGKPNGFAQLGNGANLTQQLAAECAQQFASSRGIASKIAGEVWSHKMPEFKKALALRLEVIKSEVEDALNVAKAVIASKDRALTEARERGSMAQQVTRASNQLAEARERYEMTLALWEQRALWLEELYETPLKLEPRELSASTIKVTMGQQ